jgi:hypothetical protein
MNCFFCHQPVTRPIETGYCSNCQQYPGISQVSTGKYNFINGKDSFYGRFVVAVKEKRFTVICHFGYTEIFSSGIEFFTRSAISRYELKLNNQVMRINSQPLNPCNALAKLPIYVTFS